MYDFFFSSRRRHTRCALVTGVQTCALPIYWVAEIESDKYEKNDWNQKGRLEDFFPVFRDWRFDWLDMAGLLEHAEIILEYPMEIGRASCRERVCQYV